MRDREEREKRPKGEQRGASEGERDSRGGGRGIKSLKK